MDVKTPISIISVVFISALATGCCQQPQAHGGGATSGGKNCHTHSNNAKRGTTRHCHAHVNGSNHTHSYGQKKVAPRSNYKPRPQAKPPANNNYSYPTYYDTKKKGYYRGDVGSVIDPYAKDVLRDYRE